MLKGQSHPAAQVSKNMIAEALIQLIDEGGYHPVTITALCERAQIARRTFYRNFDTVEDVLRFIGKQTIEAFVREMQLHEKESYFEILVAFLSFWIEHADRFALFAGNNLTHILFEGYIQSLVQIPFLLGSVAENSDATGILQAYTAGGLWSVLMYRFATANPASPEELARLLSASVIAR